MVVKKLYFLPAGRCMLDHSSINSTLNPGKLLNLPVWCYLLETSEGPILIYTPGHSPGHQSIFIQTEKSGPVLLTIDASYTKENFENGVPFAGFDSERAAMSIERLKDIVQKEKPIVFFGHDMEQEKGWKTYPEYW